MANAKGKCVVCGSSPTVKAHLFPRALLLDVKGDSPQLVAGSRHRDGFKLSQNGEWDDRFLCETHETQIGRADDYGVRFCRRYFPTGTLWPDQKAINVRNPRPSELLHFAYAIVWRHVACASGRELELQLGPYENIILSALLSSGPFDLELLVAASPLTVNGERVNMAVAPYQARMGAMNVMHFSIGQLDFYLKTDQRKFPVSWRSYLANGNNPIVVSRTEDRDFRTIPKYLPILQRMKATTWKG